MPPGFPLTVFGDGEGRAPSSGVRTSQIKNPSCEGFWLGAKDASPHRGFEPLLKQNIPAQGCLLWLGAKDVPPHGGSNLSNKKSLMRGILAGGKGRVPSPGVRTS
jgi:hypothetical protein